MSKSPEIDQSTTIEQFLEEYVFGLNDAYQLERDWYLRPWRSGKRKPAVSGVYPRRHPNFWVGFAYFDAKRGVWLMAFESRASAQRLADDYLAERNPSNDVYASRHQGAQWSQAPDGLSSFAYPLNQEDLLTLALLRYAVDPKLRLRGIR